MTVVTGKLLDQDWMVAAETVKIMEALHQEGGAARFVGGCVRNALVNRKVLDIDIATPLRPEEVMARLEKNKIGYAPTLNEALNQVFGGDSGADAPDAGITPDVTPTSPSTSPSPGTSPSPSTSGTPSPSPSGTGSDAELNKALADAAQAMRDSSQALAKGDFTAYGQAQDRLKDALNRAIAANAGGK